jgi:hypothetical protein
MFPLLCGPRPAKSWPIAFDWVAHGEPVPDKVTPQPYLGREAVCFSSILHVELKSRAAAAG